MYATVVSAGIRGLEAFSVTVEADVSDGLPVLVMVGALAGEVKESRDRVRSALRNSGFHFPMKRITVSFMPADVRKEGAGFDLPVAIAILCAFGMVPAAKTRGVLFVGELGLDGTLAGMRGVMEIAARASSFGCHTCVVPRKNLQEGCMLQGIRVLGADTLNEVTDWLKGKTQLEEADPGTLLQGGAPEETGGSPDFKDLRGQEAIRRCAQIAVSGFHNLLMIGPPGSGKTMAARCIPSILPALTPQEALEISRIHSVAGTIPEGGYLLRERPFRAPHHTVTKAALAGGGSSPRPGEVSLAHRGVLYLDELPEFRPEVLEVLRQPLEDGFVTISRSSGSCRFPARFMLVASMNPCRCGFYPDRTKCRCQEGDIRRYLGRISTPLLDRIDLCAAAEPVSFGQIAASGEEESSLSIREKVEAAMRIQKERYEGTPISGNAHLTPELVRKYCRLDHDAQCLLREVFTRMGLTGRSYIRLLRVSRTIADMAGEERILEEHLAEAVSYRMPDRKYWQGREGDI